MGDFNGTITNIKSKTPTRIQKENDKLINRIVNMNNLIVGNGKEMNERGQLI